MTVADQVHRPAQRVGVEEGLPVAAVQRPGQCQDAGSRRREVRQPGLGAGGGERRADASHGRGGAEGQAARTGDAFAERSAGRIGDPRAGTRRTAVDGQTKTGAGSVIAGLVDSGRTGRDHAMPLPERQATDAPPAGTAGTKRGRPRGTAPSSSDGRAAGSGRTDRPQFAHQSLDDGIAGQQQHDGEREAPPPPPPSTPPSPGARSGRRQAAGRSRPAPRR